jgi:hypothetical protein
MKVAAAMCVMLVLLGGASISQTQPDSLPSVPRLRPADTSAVSLLAAAQKKDTVDAGYRETKSPLLALLLSAALPGAGQFYNESYWKVPIVLGFGYYFASNWIDLNDSTKHYRRLYAQSITPQTPNGDGRYLQLREFYKDQRDTFSWYLFIYYLVNLVDAYVDASLYDFNVGDDLSLRVLPQMPSPSRPSVGVRVQVRF